ncbi:MAG: gamma-glutamyl-gamma-aminobutyrate hydrolase family protein [Alphaproteobacteria bacterium]|nr:gamma-glutamyl-gamma-aminobutyrate hydrolase family protein [Alphaproteobacteria bacterium]
MSDPSQSSKSAPPLIGVQCCTRPLRGHPTHAVVEKYLRAVRQGAEALPLLVPALGDVPPADVVARLDGLLLPGARSDVAPEHYGGAPAAAGRECDPARDQAVLPLIRAALAADLPVLAICRGIQELNVALGGTLHPAVHAVAGRLDHRAEPDLPVDERYAYTAHTVRLAPGGLFAGLAGADTVAVNSLHYQGIDRLAPGLAVEATAPDGQIEAVRAPAARFVVGVQWHPEYRFGDNDFSRALFRAFGAACRARAARRIAATA